MTIITREEYSSIDNSMGYINCFAGRHTVFFNGLRKRLKIPRMQKVGPSVIPSASVQVAPMSSSSSSSSSVGYNGISIFSTGIIYAPYIPIVNTTSSPLNPHVTYFKLNEDEMLTHVIAECI